MPKKPGDEYSYILNSTDKKLENPTKPSYNFLPFGTAVGTYVSTVFLAQSSWNSAEFFYHNILLAIAGDLAGAGAGYVFDQVQWKKERVRTERIFALKSKTLISLEDRLRERNKIK